VENIYITLGSVKWKIEAICICMENVYVFGVYIYKEHIYVLGKKYDSKNHILVK
jgi:hypothetical protein